MHTRIEAMKLAYSDLRRYDADPRTSTSRSAQMLSKDYARKRAALIDPKKANCEVPPGQPVGSDTTYLTVVDREGNIASWIQSVYGNFGSGITVEGMGFSCTIAAPDSLWRPDIPTCSPAANARFTPSFPRSWRRATCTSASASWADRTSRWRTRSSFPTSSTTA